MNKRASLKSLSWDFYSFSIIAIYFLLQIMRWGILPQFIDIYYHLLTAWGFIRAGGYVGWDFWQYAPVGRVHIYPPLFQIILAFFIKLGISKIILAKLFETVMPVIFLIVLWRFIRRNYNARLAFFVMLAVGSSFSYYLSLLDHLPATLAVIFGLLAWGELFRNKSLCAALLLSLCFYTHIGISWLFALSFVLFGLFNHQYRKPCFIVFVYGSTLSLPILFKQLTAFKFISLLGWNLTEIKICQVKIIDYVLAASGLILSFKNEKKYRLFLSLFLASFIFVIYPYRFFSGEGYLPIILLSALFLDALYERLNKIHIKYIFISALAVILFLSPTVLMSIPQGKERLKFKPHFFDSALMGMLFAKGNSLWFPGQYLSCADAIKKNSTRDDIIYSSLDFAGVILAGISERATANALFPEIGPYKQFSPVSVSKIIIFLKDENPSLINSTVNNYNLIKIFENEAFLIYKNPSCGIRVDVKKAGVPFRVILLIGLAFIFLFLLGLTKKY
jgi:hypothetical protein